MAALGLRIIALIGAFSGAAFLAAPPAMAAGLPQLDTTKFSSQLIWLVLTFGVLYLLMWRMALPRISQILEKRQHRIEDNLKKAERFRADAEKASLAYDATMTEAREKARDEIRKTRDEIRQEAELRISEQTRRLAADVKAAEGRIHEARTKAEADIRTVAADLARETVIRLGGGAVSEAEAEAAVESPLKERG